MIGIWIPLLLSTVAYAAGDNETIEETFSLPPTNIPLTKVELFGKQIFVRQPFRLPKREAPQFDDITAKLFSPFLARVDSMALMLTTTTTTTRAPTTTEEPGGRQRRNYGYGNGYDAYPQKPKYPLSQCYTNEAGFMCCNKKLEDLIHDTFANLTSDPKFQSCNVQKIANELQNKAQEKFGTEFEVVSAIGDFASKTHFYSDLICKTEKEGRFMIAYATPNRHIKPPPTPEPPAYRKFRQALEANKPPLTHTVLI